MASKQEPQLLTIRVVGDSATVAFCRVGQNAPYEGLEYLSSLSASDQKKFEARFIRIAALGHLNNREQFNDEGQGIWFIKN